jgi:hypothetical protein
MSKRLVASAAGRFALGGFARGSARLGLRVGGAVRRAGGVDARLVPRLKSNDPFA